MKKLLFISLFIFIVTSVVSAATLTTNYSLTKPGVGDTGWGDSVNTNFDTIDSQMKTNADAILDDTGAQVITGDWDFGGGGIEIENSTSVPGSCTVGQVFLDTDATSGQQLYACEGGTFVAQGGASFDSTTVDATTWSDNANASNIWTFDVSGTDHTMTIGSAEMTFSDKVTAQGGIDIGDNTSGDQTLTFDGDAGTDGAIVWDVSEDAFVYDSILQLYDDTAPVVDTAGDIAFDTNLWAASRGTPVLYDGTASIALIGALVSDTPSNGEVPKWNTGGTITWEVDSTGSGLGTNLSSSTNEIATDNSVIQLNGTGQTNNEDLDFDFETTANEVGVSSSTGVTAIDFGAIAIRGGSFEADPSATPTTSYTDSDTTDEDVSTQIVTNCTDTATTTEDCDITLSQQIAGAMTAFITADADGDVVVARFQDATTALEGDVELATTAEIDTGTDSTRAMPVDQFVASKRNIRWLVFNLVEAGTDVATATNIYGDFESPIAGTILQDDSTPFYLYATNSTAGTTGTMVVDISIGGTSIMTTNKLDFDTTEKTTTTAATPPDLTTTSLAVGDIITIDIDSIHTTAAQGLTVYMAVRE